MIYSPPDTGIIKELIEQNLINLTVFFIGNIVVTNILFAVLTAPGKMQIIQEVEKV
jgi:hypothetical protein